MKRELLPLHLQKYVVEQDESQYTPVDHSVWRFILRQLRSYLSVHAHEAYLSGLEKTGISIERIPLVSQISEKISKFGWRAIPVSGFIPPAAFMELQALSVLPIACDIRSLDHLLYTPAPDIVHEAAGHAPMLAHSEYAEYLKNYAQVARKAIISKDDMDVYAAIRELSDIKEHPSSTPQQIKDAEAKLDRVTKAVSHVSEATWLSRMNWWTAEYGLIGSLENPRIYGAGLLSSVGEARSCLEPKVQKKPITVDCIDCAYDITERQPQLFVTPDFPTLTKVLKDLAQKMAFKIGGVAGVRRIIQAATVNTVELNSELQISGTCVEVLADAGGEAAYLRFEGPSQLSFDGKEFPGHGKDFHAHGFGTPVGLLKGHAGCPSKFTDEEWRKLGAVPGGRMKLEFRSGIVVTGLFAGRLATSDGTLLLTLDDAWAKWGDRILFQPDWGTYDMAVGSEIVSVFGGPADRSAYGETDDFVAARVAKPVETEATRRRNSHYQQVRDWRENKVADERLTTGLTTLLETHSTEFPDDWLLVMEMYELALNRGGSEKIIMTLKSRLDRFAESQPAVASVISDGVALANQI